MSVVGDIYYIEERLRDISPLLFVVFNPIKERYELFEKVNKTRHECTLENGVELYSVYEEPMHVTTIQNEDGTFRPLDQRLLVDLARMDMHREENSIKNLQAKARKHREDFDKSVADHTEQVVRHYQPLIKRELKYGL